MKRMFGVLVTALATTVVTAGTALAQSTYPPEPAATNSVIGDGGSNGPTAFTGSDVSVVAMVAVALLIVGLTALFVARRRSARAATA